VVGEFFEGLKGGEAIGVELVDALEFFRLHVEGVSGLRVGVVGDADGEDVDGGRDEQEEAGECEGMAKVGGVGAVDEVSWFLVPRDRHGGWGGGECGRGRGRAGP